MKPYLAVKIFRDLKRVLYIGQVEKLFEVPENTFVLRVQNIHSVRNL